MTVILLTCQNFNDVIIVDMIIEQFLGSLIYHFILWLIFGKGWMTYIILEQIRNNMFFLIGFGEIRQ